MRRLVFAAAGVLMVWALMALAAPAVEGSRGFEGSPVEGSPGFEGTWTARVPGPSGQSSLPVTFTFTITDGKTGGTVSTDERSFALVDVKIDGSTITFAIEGEEQNKYSGTLSGDEIKMQVKYPSHENGTRVWSFAAKHASAPAAATVPTASVEGDWEGDVPRGGGRVIEARFTFHTDGEVLTGSAHAAGDDFPIEKGRIAGTSIAFRIGGTQGDYTGTVGADEIQMKVKYDGGEAGRQTLSFVLKRVAILQAALHPETPSDVTWSETGRVGSLPSSKTVWIRHLRHRDEESHNGAAGVRSPHHISWDFCD